MKQARVNEIIKEQVEQEMNEGCHEDYLEDYDTALEFYLSNVELDSYVEYLRFEYSELTKEDATELQDDIISEIKSIYHRSIG